MTDHLLIEGKQADWISLGKQRGGGDVLPDLDCVDRKLGCERPYQP